MGFNFQGIVITRRYPTLESIIDDFNFSKLELIGESSFEEATLSIIDRNDLFVTQVIDSTFFTFGTNLNVEDVEFKLSKTPDFKALKFAIYETVMAFAFEYFESSNSIRIKAVFPGQPIEERGELLEIEQTESDLTEIIFGLIGKVTGSSFWDIELEQKSMRYKF